MIGNNLFYKEMKKTLEKLAEKRKKEMDLVYFDKYSSLFHEAYSFLSRRQALLYGGTALNELLPTDLKIYEPFTLPDIDVLSPEAKTLANDMVKFYRKKHHEAVSFTEALHLGTYKVFADGMQIADITQCQPETYQRLKKDCVVSKQWKIKIVPPYYLRMTLHKILSQPNDAHRWVNASERIEKFYKTFPVKHHCSVKKNKMVEIDTEKIRAVVEPSAVLIGNEEVKQMLRKQTVSIPLLVLTDQELMETKFLLKQQGLVVSKIFPADDFVPSHFLVFQENQVVAVVFHLETCVSYHELKKKRIASLHTMMDWLLSLSLSTYPHFQNVPFQCVADELSFIPSSSKRKIVQPFVITCYGPSVGVATMRRERVKRLLKNRNP